jgi:hypothetical protein
MSTQRVSPLFRLVSREQLNKFPLDLTFMKTDKAGAALLTHNATGSTRNTPNNPHCHLNKGMWMRSCAVCRRLLFKRRLSECVTVHAAGEGEAAKKATGLHNWVLPLSRVPSAAIGICFSTTQTERTRCRCRERLTRFRYDPSSEENLAPHRYQLPRRVIRKTCASNLRCALTTDSRPAAGISKRMRESSNNGLRLANRMPPERTLSMLLNCSSSLTYRLPRARTQG